MNTSHDSDATIISDIISALDDKYATEPAPCDPDDVTAIGHDDPNRGYFVEYEPIYRPTGNDFTIKTIDLGDYGTSYEVTKHGSDRKLILTTSEDNLIDMILYDKTGTTVAVCDLFEKAVTDITPEGLATLITICF